MPLSPAAESLFTMVPTTGLFSPSRVPQRVLSVTPYFQKVMRDVLGFIERIYLILMDDIVILECRKVLLIELPRRFPDFPDWWGMGCNPLRNNPERVQGLKD